MPRPRAQRCPCGGGPFARCCRPYLRGERRPPTAEALMRSRYTAFARNAIDYLVETHDPETRDAIVPTEIAEFAASARWRRLEIRGTEAGGAGDLTGRVRFTAWFDVQGVAQSMAQDSAFRRLEDGRWVYVDGQDDA